MKHILLSQERIALLDDEDYDRFSLYHWCYRGERNRSDGYAIRHAKDGKKTRTSYLHREIMNPPPGTEVIFLNYDKLDCRRANLRCVAKVEARRHHRVRSDSQSKIKGIRYNPDGRTWSAYRYRHGNPYHIGNYWTEEQARAAYQAAMEEENPELFQAPEIVERYVDTIEEENEEGELVRRQEVKILDAETVRQLRAKSGVIQIPGSTMRRN